MKKNMPLLFAVVFVTLILGFQNCSKVAFDKELGNNKMDTEGEIPNDDGPDAEIPEILTKCNNAEAQGKLVTSVQKIRFDDSHQETGRSQVCEFGVGDNLSAKEGRMRARYEQSRSLIVPSNAIICDVEMSTQLQKFRYDDVFILTFNDRILATNNKTVLQQRITPESLIEMSDSSKIPLYKYDWLKLRDGQFENRSDDYCLGMAQNKSYCTWPVTERSGNIKFEFDPELLVNLGIKAAASNSRFGFIVTGDNDLNIDCAHETLEFSMEVKYYLQ